MAKLIYLTGLELGEVYALVRQGSTGPDVEVPGRGGVLRTVRLDPDARALVRDLAREKLPGQRTMQRHFQSKGDGLTARAIVAASRRDRGARYAHGDTVAPALAVLLDHPELRKVAAAFRAALNELDPGGSPDDAITDAGRALQEMMTALGAQGASLGAQADDARRRNLLGPHDTKLAAAMQNLIDWVSAERSTRGDAHYETSESADDAWLAVRVVGALLIRLEKRLP